MFDDRRKEKVIMDKMPDYEDYIAKKEKLLSKKILEYEYRFMYCEPLLSKEQEYHLFRQYNFLKYKYKKARIIPENYVNKINEIRSVVVCANARLIVSVMKTQRYKDFEAALSDGYYGLIDAVDLFDFRKGFKFATYAYWAIQTKIRYFSKVELIKTMHIMNNDEWLEKIPDRESNDPELHELRSLIIQKLKTIPERERKVITHFFGLDGDCRLGLREISEKLKISKERVRQIKEMGLRRIQKMEFKDVQNLSSYG